MRENLAKVFVLLGSVCLWIAALMDADVVFMFFKAAEKEMRRGQVEKLKEWINEAS